MRDNSPVSSSIENDEGNSNSRETSIETPVNDENSDDCDIKIADLSLQSPEVKVELIKAPENSIKIVKNYEIIENSDDEEVILRNKKGETSALSSCESFSVKEEIEKIERQIKMLEGKEMRRRTSSVSNEDELLENRLERGGSRRSLQENRRNFFRELTRPVSEDSRVKIEIKELPREQNDIKIVCLTNDSVAPVPVDAPKNAVKIIELHISEPIKQKPEFTTDLDINPIPKPRRLDNLQGTKENEKDKEDKGNSL